METILTHTIRMSVKIGLVTFLLCLSIGSVFAQNHDHASCISPEKHACTNDVEIEFVNLKTDNNFTSLFLSNFNINYSDFIFWNDNEEDFFIAYLSTRICYGSDKIEKIGEIFIELIEKTKENYWFKKPALNLNSDMLQIGKHQFLSKKQGDDNLNEPKTAACLNAGFELSNHTGWNTFCGTTTGAFLGATGGETSTGCGAHHTIVTGGTDAFTGSPRVFQGGASAMLGDGTGTGSRYGRLRKDFVVSASNPAVTYSYMAVLQDPEGHTPAQSPFFNANLFVNGDTVHCAKYFSYYGDGAPGWVYGNGVAYRDWTSVFVPLDAYIGQTVTLEITAGDCSPSAHYAYAYVDVSCEIMEVEQFCEGTSTVLSAPTQGIEAWEWSTGATTPQITVTTPGIYTVNVLPLGSTCSALLTYEASIYPAPTADFTVAPSVVCLGGSIDATSTSTIDPGTSNITGYNWHFGDTPTSAVLVYGSETSASHVYNTIGDFDITLSIETSDGCTASSQYQVSVIQGPEATIAGNNTVCSGDPDPQITFTGSVTTGPYTFTYNVNGGPDQTVSTTAPNSSVSIPVPTSPPGTYNYNLTYVLDPSTAQCAQAQTGTATIIINPLPTATIATDAVVCQGAASQTITFTGANGVTGTNYQFAYAVNGGATQTINSPAGSSTATITIPTTVADTFVYTLYTVTDLTTNCSDTVNGGANISTVVINPMPNATIAGAIVVCQNDTEPVITFTGNNSYGDYLFTYSINSGVAQTITATGTTVATVNVPTNVATTYTYELISVTDPLSGCSQNINQTQVVTVNPLPTAIVTGTTTICQHSASPQITFTGANGVAGTSYQFTYSVNGGVQQTVTSAGVPSVTVNVPTSVATTYNYTIHSVVDLTTGCSQTQTGSAAVTINPTPFGSIAGNITVCQGATPPVVTFTGLNSSSNYAFSYNVNNGPIQTVTSTGSTATVNQSTGVPGTYVYELTYIMDPVTMCGSDTSLTITVVVNSLPTVQVSAPVEACYLSPNLPVVTFEGVNGTSPFTFTYNINGGANQFATSTGNIYSTQVPTNTVGDFIYTITNVQDNLGCQQNVNVSTMVSINPLPIVSAGSDITVCAGTTIVLTGSGQAQQYNWDNGVTNGVPFIPTDTTTYTVIGIDHNLCENTDQVTVYVVPIPVMDIVGQNLSGCSPVVPTLQNNSTGNLTNCTWYLGNGDVIQGCGTASSVFDSPGCFDVTLVVSTPEGCSNSLTLTNYICVDAQPIADFYPNPALLTTYDWESTMVNESVGASSYVWDFGDGSPHSTQHSPTHAFPNEEGGFYTVTLIATSMNGCVDTAYATVEVKEELIYYVPNTFTPDSDDYNETFKPIFTTGFDPYNYGLYIYNRWGELIFESHDTSIGWNGKYGVDGNLCQDGTYTWKIEVKKRIVDEHLQFVGHVNLLR